MTTYHTPDTPPPAAAPADPLPNKAIAAAVTTLLTVGVQWALSGELNVEQEAVTAIGGALATVLVYVISNWTRRGF